MEAQQTYITCSWTQRLGCWGQDQAVLDLILYLSLCLLLTGFECGHSLTFRPLSAGSWENHVHNLHLSPRRQLTDHLRMGQWGHSDGGEGFQTLWEEREMSIKTQCPKEQIIQE